MFSWCGFQVFVVQIIKTGKSEKFTALKIPRSVVRTDLGSGKESVLELTVAALKRGKTLSILAEIRLGLTELLH